jgi:hypothetical protein
MREPKVTYCLLNSNSYVRYNLRFLAIVIAIMASYLLLWIYISIQLMQHSVMIYGIGLGTKKIIQALLEIIVIFIVNLKCYEWLSKTTRKLWTKRLIGLLCATVLVRAALLLIFPFLIPAIFTWAGYSHISNVSQIVSAVIATSNFLIEALLLFYAWPILIIMGVGPIGNLQITFKSVTKNIKYLIPSIGYIALIILEKFIRPHFKILLMGFISEMLIIIAAIYLSIYQMTAFYSLQKKENA